jgi:UDP-GlcNAc:undecaprenyl-phosphate GlcNAc-1-phosphate transferase
MVTFVLAFFTAAAFSLVLTPLVAGAGIRAGILDHPGHRKIHTMAVPRVGGASIALALGLALAVLFTLSQHLRAVTMPDLAPIAPVLAGALVVFVVGLLDDVRGLSPGTKLGGEVIAAGVVVAFHVVIDRVTLFGTTYHLGWLEVPATLLWIVGLTNAFNLVDGIDGLAGGLACIAASTCAAILIVRGGDAEALMLVAFVGAVVGFLPYNLNPAEVFLGDAGSLLCGFLLGVTAIAGRQKEATALAVGVPLLIFALPILDTGLAIVRRVVGSQQGHRLSVRDRLRALSQVLAGDQAHIHHRLLAAGFSQRRAVLALYALALTCSVLALLSMEVP